MRTLVALLLLLSLAACDSAGPETAQVPSEAEAAGEALVRLGDAAVIDGVEVRFTEVVADDRCPEDVVCVWAGYAEVALEVAGEPVRLGVGSRTGVRVGDRVVAVVDLTPYPRVHDPSDDVPTVEVAVFAAGA